jgi:hypothetical protein
MRSACPGQSSSLLSPRSDLDDHAPRDYLVNIAKRGRCQDRFQKSISKLEEDSWDKVLWFSSVSGRVTLLNTVRFEKRNHQL